MQQAHTTYTICSEPLMLCDDPFAHMTEQERHDLYVKNMNESIARETLVVLLDELELLRQHRSLGLGYYIRVKQLFDITMRASIRTYEGYRDFDLDKAAQF